MNHEEKNHIGEGSQTKGLKTAQETPVTKTVETNPRLAAAYYDRANAFYNKGEYQKVWEDIDKARSLGYQVPKKFLKTLRKVSERER